MKKDMSIFNKLMRSFDNGPGGFSARKLSAFVGVMVAIYATYEFVDTTTVISALMVWLTFALLCLGIITAEQVLRFKGQAEPEKEIEEPTNNDKPEDPKI
jgi:hypothetical protein